MAKKPVIISHGCWKISEVLVVGPARRTHHHREPASGIREDRPGGYLELEKTLDLS